MENSFQDLSLTWIHNWKLRPCSKTDKQRLRRIVPSNFSFLLCRSVLKYFKRITGDIPHTDAEKCFLLPFLFIVCHTDKRGITSLIFLLLFKTKKLGGEGLLCLFVVYCIRISLSWGVGQRYSLIVAETPNCLGST